VERTETNPLRVLDCKNPECQAELADAPRMLDCLCDECRAHFEDLKRFLTAADVEYVVDTGIVRGLDYYTKTVFELTAETENGTLTACGGGRYDRLVEEIGGPDIPAVGFGMGMERVMMLYDALPEAEKKIHPLSSAPDVFVASLNRELAADAFELTLAFRKAGIRADMDHAGRSLKAQFKYADKLGAAYVTVLGEDEIAKGTITLRNMATREETQVPITDAPETLKRLAKAENEEA
jgi:histidyl-tRNA synthetase